MSGGPRGANLLRLLKASAIVCAAFSLLTIFDQLHRLLELFSHFRLQYCIAAAIIAAIFIALRDRNWAIGMLAITTINAAHVVPWYFAPAQELSAAATTFTVLHANVYRRNDEYHRFLALVKAERPDVFFVQEMSAGLREALQVVHAEYPYRRVIVRDDNFGIAVYSRMLLENVVRHESPPYGLPSLLVAIKIEAKLVTLVSTHPMPPVGRSKYDGRNLQLQDIGELVNSAPHPIVLIGDLNTSMWARHYKLLLAQTGLRNARDGFGLLPSWPVQLPFAMIPIDQCLVSTAIEVIDIRTGPAIGSDHLPLIVTLTVNAS